MTLPRTPDAGPPTDESASHRKSLDSLLDICATLSTMPPPMLNDYAAFAAALGWVVARLGELEQLIEIREDHIGLLTTRIAVLERQLASVKQREAMGHKFHKAHCPAHSLNATCICGPDET